MNSIRIFYLSRRRSMGMLLKKGDTLQPGQNLLGLPRVPVESAATKPSMGDKNRHMPTRASADRCVLAKKPVPPNPCILLRIPQRIRKRVSERNYRGT
jgi:hypothetical protein